MTVAEVTYSNSISVSEHVVMMILALVRNYMPSYEWVVKRGWNIADCVERSYDLEGMTWEPWARGGSGWPSSAASRPSTWSCTTRTSTGWTRSRRELGLTFHPNAESLVQVCDVVTINTPLHPETEGLFDDKMLGDEAGGVPHEHRPRQDLRP